MNVLNITQKLALVLLLGPAPRCIADIVRDGSIGLGSDVQPLLQNGEYLIGEELGERRGSNLIHSFEQFNISEGETATFTGSSNIEAIISRVTGDQLSTIDGTLRTAVSGADFYLLNPNGVLFGSNSSIEVSGSLNVSTADSLLFSNGETLWVHTENALPILSAASPERFGLLGNNGAAIEFDNSDFSNLAEINLQAEQILLDNQSQLSSLNAINLQARDIEIGSNSSIEITAASGTVTDASIRLNAENRITLYGSKEPERQGSLVVFAQNPESGRGEILLQADSINLLEGASIYSRSNNLASGSDIKLRADSDIFFQGLNAGERGGILLSQAFGNQLSGSISLRAANINLDDGADIIVESGNQRSGDIAIVADDSLFIGGRDIDGGNESVAIVQSITRSEAESGNILLSGRNITLADDALILNSSLGAGDANTIEILAVDTLDMDGAAVLSTAFDASEAANGGDIRIEAGTVNLLNSAKISSGVLGAGQGGNIDIIVVNSLNLSGDSGEESPEGSIEGDKTGSRIETQAFDGSTGNAGSIRLEAESINLSDNAIILNNAYAGNGGEIILRSDSLSSIDSDIITNVRTSDGNGGDIQLSTSLAVLRNSNILAQAIGGNGGDINLEQTEVLFQLGDSQIDASSVQGADGTVSLPPNTFQEFDKKILVTDFIDTSNLLGEGCDAYRDDAQFNVFSLPGVSASPEGLLPSDSEADEGFASLVAENSIEAWSQQVADYADSSDTQVYRQALRGMASAQQKRGLYRQSLATLKKLASIDRPETEIGESDARRSARMLSALGNALLASDDHQAEQVLLSAIELAKNNQDAVLQAGLNNNLGNYYSVNARHWPAFRAYLRSAKLSINQRRPLDAARAYANLARSEIALRDYPQALSSLNKSRGFLSSLGSEGDSHKATILIHVAKSYQLVAQNDAPRFGQSLLEANRVLLEAEVLSRQLQDETLQSYALGNLSRLYQLDSRSGEALALARRAIQLAQSAQAPESLYRWHWQEGQLLRQRGELKGAIQAYRRAVAVIEASQQANLQRYENADVYFRQLVEPVYLDLVDALLKQSEIEQDAAAKQRQLAAAREVVEQYKVAELKNYYRHDCSINLEAQRTPVENATQDAAVIYPVILPERIELLLSLPGKTADQRQLRRFSLPLSSDNLTQTLNTFRSHLENFSTSGELMKSSQQLYRWLVKPYRELLDSEKINTLVFVPAGQLRLIPMAALHDGEKFLVENYAVALTSTLSLLDPRPLQGGKLLLAGLSEAVNDFPALDYVPYELSSIAALRGGEVLLDGDFNAEDFAKEVQGKHYSVIHVASHAQFTGDDSSSFLQTYDQQMDMSALKQIFSSTKYRERPLELLVLSACQTASGDARAGLGLAGVALKAGARSALGSLWNIGDQSTALLMQSFYRHLYLHGVSKAEALRRAQLSLLEQESFAHPSYWSAFLLMDNWL
ncbi:MAG: CHAT domain-containing protein [Cellvibrionaceae bacterium]|nr:CHAT domain-containing protein [Cellvibrionaceae bacterium]